MFDKKYFPRIAFFYSSTSDLLQLTTHFPIDWHSVPDHQINQNHVTLCRWITHHHLHHHNPSKNRLNLRVPHRFLLYHRPNSFPNSLPNSPMKYSLCWQLFIFCWLLACRSHYFRHEIKTYSRVVKMDFLPEIPSENSYFEILNFVFSLIFPIVCILVKTSTSASQLLWIWTE